MYRFNRILQTLDISNFKFFQINQFKFEKVYTIRLQRFRDQKIYVSDKNLISLKYMLCKCFFMFCVKINAGGLQVWYIQGGFDNTKISQVCVMCRDFVENLNFINMQLLATDIQGVPRKMTVVKRFESCIRTLNLDIQTSTYFHIYSSRNKIHKILLDLSFPKCGLPFIKVNKY